MKYLRLLFDNMWRNPLRTILTSMGTMVLVCVVTLIFTILTLLDAATAEKSQNLKAIVTEKWQIPSQMPYSYAGTLAKGAPREPGDIEVPEKDSMVWSFFGGSLNSKPSEGSNDDKLFAFCLKPRNLYEMMDDLDSLKEPVKSEFRAIVDRLEANRRGIILGKDRLEKLKKKAVTRIPMN
jgi:putative ABC transport system permease protein